jgi:uncharacterized protein (TIGR02271 family)
MAEWEKVVSVYDNLDKAKSALNVLRTSGVDTSHVSILDRSTLGSGIDQGHVGLWRRLFGENVWEHEAAVYGDTIKRGGAVLAVRAPKENVAKIMSILDAHKPVDVHEQAARIGSDVPVEAKALVTAPGTTTSRGDIREMRGDRGKDQEVVRLAEEQLNVGKRMFETGTTRIRRFVTERPVEAKVNLHEEHATVLRRAVSDPGYIKDIDWSDKEYEVTETAEQPVVSKTARVVEEVAFGKEGSDRTETVRDTVRRQQVEVEKLDPTKKKTA